MTPLHLILKENYNIDTTVDPVAITLFTIHASFEGSHIQRGLEHVHRKRVPVVDYYEDAMAYSCNDHGLISKLSN